MSEFRRVFNIQPVVLYKDDLFELEDIIKSDLQYEGVELTIRLDIDEDQTKTISSFRDINFSINNNLNGMRIEFINGNRPYNAIYLSFREKGADFQIASSNQTWYFGKISQLNQFFKKKRPWYYLITKNMPIIAGILPAIFAFGITFYWGKEYLPLIFAILIALSFYVDYRYTKNMIFPYTKININPRPESELGLELISVVIGGLTLLVTILSVIIDKYK